MVFKLIDIGRRFKLFLKETIPDLTENAFLRLLKEALP